MKKIILTAIAAIMLVSAQAQQGNRGGGMRQQLAELNTISDEKILDKKLKDLQSSSNEEDNLLAYYYYSSKEQSETADRIKDRIMQKFPEGQMASQEKLKQISELTDLEEKDRQFMEMYTKKPEGSYAFVAYSIAQEFAAKGNEEKMKFYAGIYGNGATDGRGNSIPIEQIYASLAGAMVSSNPDLAATYLKPGVDRTKASVDAMLESDTADANLLMRAKNNYYSYLTTYIYALAMGSNPEAGYQFAFNAYNELQKDPQSQNGLAYMEGAYLQVLLKTERYKEALPLLEKTIIAKGMPGEMRESLKKAYIAVHGSETNFTSYEKELLAKQEDKLLKEIAKKAINEPSHDFTLKDVDGNTVKLSDLRGKVVM